MSGLYDWELPLNATESPYGGGLFAIVSKGQRLLCECKQERDAQALAFAANNHEGLGMRIDALLAEREALRNDLKKQEDWYVEGIRKRNQEIDKLKADWAALYVDAGSMQRRATEAEAALAEANKRIQAQMETIAALVDDSAMAGRKDK